MERPESYFKKVIVMFASVMALIFFSDALRSFVEVSIHSRDFSELLPALPDFLSSSIILAVPSTLVALILFWLYEYINVSKYFRISSYAAVLTSLPLFSFISILIPKNPTLIARNAYCEIYRNGLITPCGALIASLDLIGSVLTVMAIVLVKNAVFPKVEAK